MGYKMSKAGYLGLTVFWFVSALGTLTLLVFKEITMFQLSLCLPIETSLCAYNFYKFMGD